MRCPLPTLTIEERDKTREPKLGSGRLRALRVEDEPADAELALGELRHAGFEASADVVQTAEEFTALVRKNSYDVVLADYKLPNWNGMESVEVLRQEGLEIPVIMVSGALGELTAVECIKQGAADYVLKDHLTRLPESVRRALREKKLWADHKQASEELARSNRDLEQFAYVASHDLQEPLRMVATYTQLLAERYQGKLDENADKYIHYAVDGALRMQKLVQDLLAFSRVGRQGTEMRSTDCKNVVEEALQNLERALQESGAAVTYDQLPVVMHGRWVAVDAGISEPDWQRYQVSGNGQKPEDSDQSGNGYEGMDDLGGRQRHRNRSRNAMWTACS